MSALPSPTDVDPLAKQLASASIDPLAKHYDGFAQVELSQEDAQAYAERLKLPEVLSEKPSLDLLRRIQIAHLEQIAKGSSPLSYLLVASLTPLRLQTPPLFTSATTNGTSQTTRSAFLPTSLA
jgi:hypothetical protein